jgi:aspartate 1-decarboxylase
MLRIVARAKIQRPCVTGKNLFYEGSITIDRGLLALADIAEGELVQVVNVNTGARFETYVLKGRRGEVCLNGGTARLGEIGDQLIIIAYGILEAGEVTRHEVRKVIVDDRNRVKHKDTKAQRRIRTKHKDTKTQRNSLGAFVP